MKHTLVALAAIALFALSGYAKKPLPPQFDDAFTWSQGYDKKTHMLLLSVNLKPGYHAYAAGESVGVPVELVVDKTGGWVVQGKPVLPKGKEKDLGALGKSVLLEGKFVISAKVSGGKGAILGALKMQICTESACDRPKTHPFKVPT